MVTHDELECYILGSLHIANVIPTDSLGGETYVCIVSNNVLRALVQGDDKKIKAIPGTGTSNIYLGRKKLSRMVIGRTTNKPAIIVQRQRSSSNSPYQVSAKKPTVLCSRRISFVGNFLNIWINDFRWGCLKHIFDRYSPKPFFWLLPQNEQIVFTLWVNSVSGWIPCCLA